MNFKICILLATFSFSCYAANINLNVGDSITLLANTQTTVTCASGDGTNCKIPIGNLNTKFNLCTQQLNSVEDCIAKLWPNFKKGYSGCIDEAFSSCTKFCKESAINLDCLELCK